MLVPSLPDPQCAVSCNGSSSEATHLLHRVFAGQQALRGLAGVAPDTGSSFWWKLRHQPSSVFLLMLKSHGVSIFFTKLSFEPNSSQI